MCISGVSQPDSCGSSGKTASSPPGRFRKRRTWQTPPQPRGRSVKNKIIANSIIYGIGGSLETETNFSHSTKYSFNAFFSFSCLVSSSKL